MKKKFLAVLLTLSTGAMLFGCGQSTDTQTQTETAADAESAEETADAEGESSGEADAESDEGASEDAAATESGSGSVSIDFEDGNCAFVGYTSSITGGTGESELEVVDYNGSKALKVTPEGKMIMATFQMDALLGDSLSDVKSVQVTLGTESPDGNFYASSGNLYSMTGEKSDVKNNTAWSVYLEDGNPKTVTYDLPEGVSFTEGNYFAISLETDNANSEGAGQTILYIDDVAFLDADGNALSVDTSAEFVAEENSDDPNLYSLKDATELEGFSVSEAGWAQAGIDLTDDMKALLVPGSIIEIEYSADTPVWLVAVSDEENPNPLGTWLRGVNQETFEPNGFVSTDGNKIQYTYEQLVEFFGEDWEQYTVTLQCESASDWSVSSVKVGTDSGYRVLGNKTALEGFEASADGWAQAGITLTDEQRELLKPGSYIEIEYSSETPVWFVNVSTDENPNPKGTWLRGVDESTFEPCGAVNGSGDKIVYTYEQLAEFWGDGWEEYTDQLQCESQSAWQVFSVSVGTPLQIMSNGKSLEGFTASADGWAQAGVELTDEMKELLKPGKVINISYSAASPVWFVAVSGDDNPNPNGSWIRGVNEETFVPDGLDTGNGVIQYTYEQLAEYFGDGWEEYTVELQGESADVWEIYSVTVGDAVTE